MKTEYIEYALYVYFLVGFLLWLWAVVDDAMTGNRHHGGIVVTVSTLVAMLLGWPFLVVALLKPRGRR